MPVWRRDNDRELTRLVRQAKREAETAERRHYEAAITDPEFVKKLLDSLIESARRMRERDSYDGLIQLAFLSSYIVHFRGMSVGERIAHATSLHIDELMGTKTTRNLVSPHQAFKQGRKEGKRDAKTAENIRRRRVSKGSTSSSLDERREPR